MPTVRLDAHAARRYERRQRRRSAPSPRRARSSSSACWSWLDPADVGLGERPAVVLRRRASSATSFPDAARRVLARRQDLPVVRAVHRRARPADRARPQLAQPGAVPAAPVRRRLHRRRPRHPGDPLDLPLGFGVPALRHTAAVVRPLVIWGSVALVVTYSAYVAEVFRAGIESVHETQRAAARSLGMSTGQTMRTVVLPQAVRRVVPPLMNDFVSLQKDVALISVHRPGRGAAPGGDREAPARSTSRPTSAPPCSSSCVLDPADPAHRPPAARERRRTSGTVVG